MNKAERKPQPELAQRKKDVATISQGCNKNNTKLTETDAVEFSQFMLSIPERAGRCSKLEFYFLTIYCA